MSYLSIERRHTGSVYDAASVPVCIRLILAHLPHGEADHIKGSCDIHLEDQSRYIRVIKEALSVSSILLHFLTFITRWKSSRLWGTSFLKLYVLTATAMPAQLTARSNFPNFSRARDTAERTSASDVTWERHNTGLRRKIWVYSSDLKE